MNANEEFDLCRLIVVAGLIVDSGRAPIGFEQEMTKLLRANPKIEEIANKYANDDERFEFVSKRVINDLCQMLLRTAEEAL
jgi:hypothetical protein